MAQETITAQDILRQSLDRNRYFYGKLMTVRDFTQEQLYFNAKRWLINRLLFGAGVVCGLQVEKAAETLTIEIKPGLALDPLGREVTVLDVPGGNKFDLTKLIKAPTTPFTGDKPGYLCLSHHECPRDPVPSLKASPCDEGCESNRWSETFDLSWDEDNSSAPAPGLCEGWMNTRTVAAEDDRFKVERTTPAWVRPNQAFEAVIRVTAKKDLTNISITEVPTNAVLIEPTPKLSVSGQFPTPPVNLKTGEFFVYVYQLTSPGTPGSIDLDLNATGLPAPHSTIDILSDEDATARENQFRLDCGEPAQTCVRIAKLSAHFTNSTLDNFTIGEFTPPRFRYTLERVTEMIDCVRASVFAEAGSPRPGHAFVTFNDFESAPPKPIAATPAPGNAFAYAGREHIHALLFAPNGGLEFTGVDQNQLRINGPVGGEAIRFLNIVKGISPVAAEDLVTKDYVDAHIAGLDWQESVLQRDLTDPPPKPNEGDRYLLFKEPTSDWPSNKNTKAKQNDIVTFTGKLWNITTPDEGTATFVENENVAFIFVDGKWVPFLAAPNAAGAGLISSGGVFAVGQGNGIVVNPDDVAVIYDVDAPQPIGPTASPGNVTTNESSRGDHVHALPLEADGGLVFDKGLRIEGPVGGKKINFLNPVSGQDPVTDQNLVTKRYVDAHASNLVAGPGLALKENTLLVGQGEGISVSEDAVAVKFESGVAQPIAATGKSGTPGNVSPGDHVHGLPLGKTSGLVFDANGLGIDGPVGGASISFQSPVAGRDPQLPEHLVTKRYVDGKGAAPPPTVVAGKGLTQSDFTLDVGAGAGVIVGDDSVAVDFWNDPPLADTNTGDPGKKSVAARGDHSHPLPLQTPSASTGVVIFSLLGPVFSIESPFIDPGLDAGAISVQLAWVTDLAGDTYMFGVGNVRIETIPFVEMAADVKLGSPGTPAAPPIPTEFRVFVQSTEANTPLPKTFQVRWFAYRPGVERPPTNVFPGDLG